MKTIFPKKECHVPKWYVVDAQGKTLGRLATEVSKLLRGKETSFYTPGVDQGNYVVILNANKRTRYYSWKCFKKNFTFGFNWFRNYGSKN
tara:strand:- start:496 stop:765 length:270 start_codon:yes stop_codon:yes gene_type:complete